MIDALLEKAWAKLLAGESCFVRRQLEARRERVFAIVKQTLEEEGLRVVAKEKP